MLSACVFLEIITCNGYFFGICIEFSVSVYSCPVFGQIRISHVHSNEEHVKSKRPRNRKSKRRNVVESVKAGEHYSHTTMSASGDRLKRRHCASSWAKYPNREHQQCLLHSPDLLLFCLPNNYYGANLGVG